MQKGRERYLNVNELPYISDALGLWADSYPRRVGRSQDWVQSRNVAAMKLLSYEGDDWEWPFISTYSFPRGHSSEGNIPQVDRLFLDFDYPDERDGFGATTRRQQLSDLLVRTRRVADVLLDEERAAPVQASLSGQKGVHLDIVFPALDPDAGSFQQFKAGLTAYADQLVDYLKSATGLDDLGKYIDVNSSDLGRLRRVPNTLHPGATDRAGEPRYCVPVTVRELSEIGVDEYETLTRSRRDVDEQFAAEPSERAAEAIEHQIQSASLGGRRRTVSGSTVDHSRLSSYERESNDDIGLDDLALVMDRPCILAYLERDDVFDYGNGSHVFEMYCITHMMRKNVPIETMVDFFEAAGGDEFDERYTRDKIREYISRAYSPVNCSTVLEQAEQFCLKDGCAIYRSMGQ